MALAKPLLGSDDLYFAEKAFVDPAVFHGFFGRSGGVSRNVYASLNCGPGSEDNPDHVQENRALVSGIVGCAPDRLLTLYQVHGTQCVTVDAVWDDSARPEADAMVTDQAGFALGILTADCAPVLFRGEKADGSPVIGAAHAGWGGAFQGVLEATIVKMRDLGAEVESIKAVIGPCIGLSSYEVDQDFYAQFFDHNPESERFFKNARRGEHYMFDLAGYCAFRLAHCGVQQVSIKDLDTYFHEEDFFSYRRATHRNEKDYGRQISVIMIK